MIPTKLKIRNFLSYGDVPQTIDFENRPIIYLSGNNGNGKSALLESITWCIWGLARKNQGVTKSDDAVMRNGSTEMFVALQFIINDQQYSIKRSCERKNKKLTTELALFAINKFDNQSFSNLTAQTQKETQELIDAIIGLDYDTFVNTVFLRQGNSNEFSKKTPKERKEIICNILGINKIENIRQKVMEDLRKESFNLEVERQNFSSLQNLILNTENLEKVKESLYIKKGIYKNEKALFLDEKEKIQIIEFKIKELFNILINLNNEEKNELELKQNFYLDYLKNRNYYLKIKQNKIKIRELKELKNKELDKIDIDYDFNAVLKIKNELICINSLIENLNFDLNQKKTEINSFYLKNLNPINENLTKNEIIKINLENELIKIEELKNENELLFEKINEAKKILLKEESEEKVEIRNFEKNNNIIKKIENKILGIKKKEIYISFYKNEEKIKECHYCNSILSDEKIEFLKKKIIIESAFIFNFEKVLNFRLKKIVEKKEKNILLLNQKKLKIREIIKNIDELKNKIDTNLKNIENIYILKRQSEDINLENIYLKNKIDELKINNLKNLDEVELKFLMEINHQKEKKLNLQNIEEKLSKLNNTLFLIDQLENENNSFESIEKIRDIIKKIIFNIRNSTKKLKKIKLELIFNSKEKEKLEKIFNDEEKNIKEKEKYLQEMHEGLIKEYTEFTILEKQSDENKDKFIKTSENYNKLKKAFDIKNRFCSLLSKDELQAILIEQSIPLIEAEANKILHMLTEGKCTIFIESIKDLKSGKTKETLDIIISDVYGARNYEFFSGGEAFRIDLSLRIAMAKVLAQRSGKSVKTFIVDEGFGSQDGVSLELVIQAIYTLQTEFDCIIIVSHLPELKDQFNTHFIVTKDINGSTVNVIDY